MAIIQLRVDDNLKEQATFVYEQLGIDLSTAIRMFLKRSVMVNGIPFSMTANRVEYDASDAKKALKEMQKISEEKGNDKMTLEEINEIIRLARLERKQTKKQ